jgi:hypothetical protein
MLLPQFRQENRTVLQQAVEERCTDQLRMSAERRRNMPPYLKAYDNLRSKIFLLHYPGKRIFRVPSPSEKAGMTMNNRDTLRNLILTHWQQYQPTMLAQFQRENRLEAELEATAQQFSDLMYELVAVKQMEYQSAWEIAIEHFLLPEEESSEAFQSQNESPPATSA